MTSMQWNFSRRDFLKRTTAIGLGAVPPSRSRPIAR